MDEMLDTAIDFAVDTAMDAAYDAQLAQIAHRTNVITIVLISIVIAANIVAIVLLLVLYHQTKRPKNVSERYKEYKTTVGTVISVEKVAYYIKRYVKRESLLDSDGKKKKRDELPKPDKSPATAIEKYSENEVIMKSPEEIAEEEPPEEIRKFRYKVFYEFTVKGSENLYTGECFIYDPHAISPGDIIEITYKPDDPMVNFTDYSLPAGFLAK